ncbi:CD209 antigen-like protein E [Stegastes partitus]|uniref:CD209 antigen-like protein E n=1 Tax=Stegastes partitus TaxID=144197 RepID=A0A3B5BF40_9TELE|nr:PREDICTED: CD209 antigen-like protein E [Stegastes partitus]
MSSNIYEEPNLNTIATYSKVVQKDGEERLDRMVDIYESADAFTDHRVDASTRDTGVRTQSLPAAQRNPFRFATLILALLCVLLLLGMIFVFQLYLSAVLRTDQVIKEAERKASRECHSGDEEGQTEDDASGWKKYQCHCYYTSTEVKTWAESKKDCERRGADLVIINNQEKQTFVSDLNRRGDSWIGLKSEGLKDWSFQWSWVDGATLTFTNWKKGVSLIPVNDTQVYIDLQGKWNHASSGAKHWICERLIN